MTSSRRLNHERSKHDVILQMLECFIQSISTKNNCLLHAGLSPQIAMTASLV